MTTRHGRDGLETPARLDLRFGAVAGFYVAALLSPPLLLAVIRWVPLKSGPLAVGLLGTVGIVLTVVVSWRVRRSGSVVIWFNTTWLAVLLPAIGIVPVVLYFYHLVLFLGFSLSDLQAETAAPLIGTTGIVLGIGASCLGSVLVQMARARLVGETIGEHDRDIEWTAGWPRRTRLKYLGATLGLLVPASGLAVWQLGWIAAGVVGSLGTVLIQLVAFVLWERTYSVTPVGLETRQGSRSFVSRRLIPWSQFEGFSVTDDAVVLHRSWSHLDIRCARSEFTASEEEDIVATLQRYLVRRNR